MIAGLKPYPAYKESDEPWLGKVPEHWEMQRTKTFLRERVEKGYPNEPLLAATQTKGVVRKEEYENRTVLALKDLHLLKLVRAGDFVISLRSFQGGIEYAREQGIISQAYTILYSKDQRMHGYLAWLFKSKPYIENLTLYVTGIRQGQNIDYEKLSRSKLPTPPLSEQSAIVRFLDYMDRRIRRYIRAKQKLIKLLEEQKQVIIHQAVTRGLDPNVRLKPSGVEWLGDVPEHWKVLPIKRAFSSITYGTSESTNSEGVYTVLGMGNIKEGQVDIQGSGRLDSIDPALLLEDKDLLFNRTNSPELVGKVGLYRKDGNENVTFASYLVRLRTNKESDPIFMNYTLNSKLILNFARRNAIPSLHQSNLNPTRYSRFSIPLPNLSEQKRIAEYLSNVSDKLNNFKKQVQNEIDLINEYRTRLIADVVTGKVDVREIAVQLPDEFEEEKVIDEDVIISEDEEYSEDSYAEAEA